MPDNTIRKFYISTESADVLADTVHDAIKELTA